MNEYDIDDWHFMIDLKKIEDSWRCLFRDLQLHNLRFPLDFANFDMKTYYARAVYLRLIDPLGDFEAAESIIKNNIKVIDNAGSFVKY